jgi:hypothetical protein
MHGTETLLNEENLISLRSLLVLDDGRLVEFRLMPATLDSAIPGICRPRDFVWALQDSAWLYRHVKSDSEEIALMNGCPCVEQDIRAMRFDKPPKFSLLWSNSGHSVALYLNGDPWAFIYEATHQGYSKGVLNPETGNLWDQKLFEKIFHS